MLEYGLSLTEQIIDLRDLDDIKDAACCGSIEWFSNQSFSACLYSIDAAIIFLNWFHAQSTEIQERTFGSSPQLMIERVLRSSFMMLSEREIKHEFSDAERISEPICKLLLHNKSFYSRYYRWDETNSSSFFNSKHSVHPLTVEGVDGEVRLHFLQQLLKIQRIMYGGFSPNLASLINQIKDLDADKVCHLLPLEMQCDASHSKETNSQFHPAPITSGSNYIEDVLPNTLEDGKKQLRELILKQWPYALANDGTSVLLEFRPGRRIRFCSIVRPTNFTATLTPEAVFSLIETIKQLNGEGCLEIFCPGDMSSSVTTAALEI